MLISEQWLREWVSPRLDTKGLAERLTMAGLEVGAVRPVAGKLGKVVVGEILSVTPHPHADRLRICQVGLGKGKILQIVCGAGNAAAGVKAPVALPGAALANGVTIRKSTIREVPSAGMLCTAVELGLEETADGLLLLGPEARPGQRIADYLRLDDSVLEIDLTPNRGDCLSIAGIAREVAALTRARLKEARISPVRSKIARRRRISLKAKEDCPRYAGRIIEGINMDAVTPVWMGERLRRAGLRSIHPVVDVTNYVMLELGQPMHAFDLDALSGGIQVRHAKKNESLTLLDGSNIHPPAGALLIADEKKPLALAGIMGGMDSAVHAGTRNLFLESACFKPETIGRYARTLGMQTDSSYRFERGVDPALQVRAIERATRLLLDIVGGAPGSVLEQKAAKYLFPEKTIPLRHARITRLLGHEMPIKRIQGILAGLGMKQKKMSGGWRVSPPSYRFDLSREEDLVEEIARVHGYEKLPSCIPMGPMTLPASPEVQGESRMRDLLVDRGYQEVITYSFVDPKIQAMIDPDRKPAALSNPISADMAVMRTSLWPGLLQAIIYNQNRQQARMRLFEIGQRFIPRKGGIDQEVVLAGAAMGTDLAEQWGSDGRDVDYYDVKADIEALWQLLGRAGEVKCDAACHPALHPGQAAHFTYGENQVGIIGALHPALQDRLGLKRPVLLFELQFGALPAADIPVFYDISRYPAIRRDLALVVDKTATAQSVLDCIAIAAGKMLVKLELFDQYVGEGIDSGRKSLALGLTFQGSSRTLKEEEVETLMAVVVSAVSNELGAQPRK